MSLSTTVVVLNVLQGTGLVAIENAYPIRDDIKTRGGTFLREGCGQILPKNVWVIRSPAEDQARNVAKELKRSSRKKGFAAKVSLCIGCWLCDPLAVLRLYCSRLPRSHLLHAVCRMYVCACLARSMYLRAPFVMKCFIHLPARGSRPVEVGCCNPLRNCMGMVRRLWGGLCRFRRV